MKAIIPLAGMGVRLQPHTHTTPKPLLRVAGKPILGHLLDQVSVLPDLEEIILITGYRGDQIEEYVRSHYSVPIRNVVQTELHGLGYAIYLAREHFGSGPALIMLGDTLVECNLATLCASPTSRMALQQVPDPRRFGVAILEDERIVELEEKPEKPRSNLAVVGVYFIREVDLLAQCLIEVVEGDIRTRKEYQLTDALERMIRRGAILKSFVVDGWFDCGTGETLLETNRVLLDRSCDIPDSPGNVILPPVYIPAGVVLENSIIGPYTSLAEGCEVRNSIIRNSIISEDAVIEEALLDGSIIGRGAQYNGTFVRLNIGDHSQVTRIGGKD